MGKIIKAEKRGGGAIESKVTEEYTPLIYSQSFVKVSNLVMNCSIVPAS